jgi:hypothetical protein
MRVAFILLTFVAIFCAKSNKTTPTPSSEDVICHLKIPNFPLSARGLATPYELLDCDMAETPSFVQAVIFDPGDGTFSIYNPLVINFGTQPGEPPAFPIMPNNAVVGIWFGSNADVLVLTNNIGLINGNCVNGLGDFTANQYFNGNANTLSPFGQYAYCNAPYFFKEVNNNLIKPQIPPLGIALDGLPCPSTLDFFLVDADPNDNLQTTYLLLPGGITVQDNPDTRAKFANLFTVLVNPSDEALLTEILYPLMNCTAYRAPDLTFPSIQLASLALNELQGAMYQQEPIALIPATNPMTLVDGNPNLNKLNLYRAGVNQPAVADINMAPSSVFCHHMLFSGLQRLMNNKFRLTDIESPAPLIAIDLYLFLINRFSNSYDTLGCPDFLNIPNPITLTLINGLVTDATIKPF